MIATKLLATYIALSLLASWGCSKKKSKSNASITVSSAVTGAGENVLLSKAAEDAALAITSLDLLGLNMGTATPLRLASNDYAADKVRFNVQDDALDSLRLSTGILCFLNQAASIEMVNLGTYLALADEDACFHRGDRDVLESQSAGRTRHLRTMTVTASRLSKLHPLVVKAWFTIDDDRDASPLPLQVKLVVAEGQSKANPVGIFRLTWEGTPPLATATQKGYVDARRSADGNSMSLNFADSRLQSGFTYERRLASTMSIDPELKVVKGGILHASKPNGTTTHEYAGAFNATHYLRRDVATGTETCFSKSLFKQAIYRYGLYNAETGARISRSAGFPISYLDEAEVKQYAWAGYWGLWPSDGSILEDGSDAEAINNATGVTKEYRIKVGKGKLLKKTKQTLTLAQLAGIELDAYSASGVSIVTYNATTNAFTIVGTYTGDTLTRETASGTYALRQAWTTGATVANSFYAASLGGDVVVYSDVNGTPTGSALYYKEENVTATSGPLDLYCYENCIKAQITEAQAQANQWDATADRAFYAFDYTDPRSSSNQHVYTYSSDDLNLQIDGLDVTLASDTTELSGFSSWGFRSGPMVTTALTEPFEAYDADVFYQWETGPHDWNKFTTIRGTDRAPATFDAPLFFTYTHALANDRLATAGSAYYDKPYLLRYGDIGELIGIPVEQNAEGLWVPSFSLKDGTLLGTASEYKVKALDGQATLQEAAGACTALSLATLPDLPTFDGWVPPTLGDRPAVTAAPKVIEGIVQ